MQPEFLVQTQGLKKRFSLGASFGSKASFVQALDDVSLNLRKGEILALVGESGSGKSTFGRALLRLVELDAGSVRVAGFDVPNLKPRELKAYRRSAQIVFQNPLASLNPRQKIGKALDEVLFVHGVEKAERSKRIEKSLYQVGLDTGLLDRYPHSFSGGQLQRLALARALLVEPPFLVADEAVSALDVSIQAQILKLFLSLKSDVGLTQLFISHDLRAVAFLADRVAVLHRGRLVEIGDCVSVLGSPKHWYTKKLVATQEKLVEAQNLSTLGEHWWSEDEEEREGNEHG